MASACAARIAVLTGGINVAPAFGEPLPETSPQDITPPQVSSLAIEPLEVA